MNVPFRPAVLTLLLCLSFLSISVRGSVSVQGSDTSQPATGASKKTTAKALPSAQGIADAKSKGLVWVNVSTHVYHKDSSSLYGTTKHGKFMTEDDAKKAGYRPAQESGNSKKHPGTK